jgi:hypothetical protein
MRKSERGGSTISNIFWLAVLLAALYAGWNIIPVYYEHYSLTDYMLEASRKHPSVNKDDVILNSLMRQVREMRMDAYVLPQNFRIQTRETSRMISVDYNREASVFPGVKRVFHMTYTADSPFY